MMNHELFFEIFKNGKFERHVTLGPQWLLQNRRCFMAGMDYSLISINNDCYIIIRQKPSGANSIIFRKYDQIVKHAGPLYSIII